MHLWLPGYLAEKKRRLRLSTKPKRVWLMLADHYEPFWNRPTEEVAEKRVAEWRRKWPEIAARHRDDAGKPPVYTFFYAEEEYRPSLLNQLADLTSQGIADVEVHLHHDGEGEQNFVSRISSFVDTLHKRHGLLHLIENRPSFGFIHGDWALDNSLPGGRCCGLNNEITLLRELGCYADFTLPSAPSPAQTQTVNQIYWAKDNPCQPRSHERGIPVTRGGGVSGDLMMIPGPLSLWWDFPRPHPHIDTGQLGAEWLPNENRVRGWLESAPRVEEDIFLKLFTHGTQEDNSAALLGGALDHCFEEIRAACSREGLALFFASAWQTWRAIETIRTLPPSREGSTFLRGY